jgi:uncharacterized membrane protein YukC
MTSIPSWLTDINNSIQGTVDYITNSNYLEYAVMSGFGDVPIAAYGMVIIVLSTLTYATVADPNNITSISNVAYNMVKSVPGLTRADSAVLDKQFTKEEEKGEEKKEEKVQPKEEEKQIQEEEAEYKKIQEEEEKEKEKEQEKKNRRKKSSGDDDDDDDDNDDDNEEDESFLRGGFKGTHGIQRSLRLKIPPSNKGIKRSTKKRRKIN